MKSFFVLLSIMAVLAVMRIHFLDEPFERDEGGYAYMAQRFLDGDLIYRDYWESRPPGIVFIYALIFKLYGQSITAVRVFSIFAGLISMVLVYLIAEKLFNRKTGYISALLYAIFSGGPFIQGSSANAEPFMIVFTLLGICLFVYSRSLPVVFLSGASFGLAFMIKQVAIDGFLAVCIYALIERRRGLFILAFGFITAWIPVLFYLAKNNIFGEFIFAAFTYNFFYVKNAYEYGWPARFKNSLLYVSREILLLWFLGLSGLFMLRRNVLMFFWLIFGIFAISFGGRFFPHYFIQIIPVLCILSGYGLNRIYTKIFPVLIVLLLTVLTILNEYKYYLVYNPYEVCRMKYPMENFVLTEILARKIEKETDPDDYIYVWGSEPEIYFYSSRKCPVRFIHNYFVRMSPVLASKGKMEIIENLNMKKPKIIVVFDTLDVFPELKDFIDKYYTQKIMAGLKVWQRL